MVEFEIKINEKQHVAYIPREVVDALGLNLKLVGNRVSAVVYPEKASLADIVKSLRILLADFEHALEMQQKTEARAHEVDGEQTELSREAEARAQETRPIE
ncbi:MAG: hypothetical protein ABSG57_07700 [Candidatus Bathyarchaeia archaeon]